MIRAKGDNKIILGLTRDNVTNIVSGRPIYVDGKTIGSVDDIIIMFGESTDDIINDLKNCGIKLPNMESK